MHLLRPLDHPLRPRMPLKTTPEISVAFPTGSCFAHSLKTHRHEVFVKYRSRIRSSADSGVLSAFVPVSFAFFVLS